MLIEKGIKKPLLDTLATGGISIPGGRVGKKVERDILSSLQGLTAVAGPAGATGPAGTSGSNEVLGFMLNDTSPAAGGGVRMGWFEKDADIGNTDIHDYWTPARAGTIQTISVGFLGRSTYQAGFFAITHNGADITVSAVTLASGVSSVSDRTYVRAFKAGDSLGFLLGGHESFASPAAWASMKILYS